MYDGLSYPERQALNEIKALLGGEFSEDQKENYYKLFDEALNRGVGQQIFDMVNKPPHYNNHPSGVECIQITRHMEFNVGNAIKYLWRYKDKNGIEDLEKAIFYIKDQIKLEKERMK